MNRLIAGRDPVLVDAFVCQEMGYAVEEVPYIRMAETLGAGCADWTHARIRELNPPVLQVVKTERRKVVEVADAVEEGGILQCLLRISDPGTRPVKRRRTSGKTGYEDLYRTGLSGENRNTGNRQLYQRICHVSEGMSAY